MNLTPDTSLALMQASQEGSAQAAKNLKNARERQRVEEAAKDFEAMFVAEMVKPMFDGIETEGPFGGGKGEEIFRGMLVQEYGKLIANTGAIGMTDDIRDQMIKMQEQANHATQTETQ